MLNIDRVWSRISQLPAYRTKKLSDFILLNITAAFQLTSLQALPNRPVTFPAGAIVVGMRAAACIDNVAATIVTGRPGLDLFTVAISDQQTQRTIFGSAQVLASSIFGPYSDQAPAKELIIPAQGGLLYSMTNMTTTTIDVYFSHDTLVPAAQP